MDWCHYRFHAVWDLDAPPAEVFAALERVDEYPLWWPQVREVIPLDEDSGDVRVRSFLPYELRVTARTLRRDPAALVLEAGLDGDLRGRARWAVAARGSGARVLYDQEAEVRKPLLRRLALPCRPVFRANHAAMMRGGRRGLDAFLRAR